MTTKEILDMDINDVMKLKKDELKLLVSQMGETTRKRLSRLSARYDKGTLASLALERGGGNITVKGKNLNQLRNEFVRARNFLDDLTGTVKGQEQWLSTMRRVTGIKSATYEDISNIFSMLDYTRNSREFDMYINAIPSDKLIKWLSEDVSSGRIDMNNIKERLESYYLRYQEEERGLEDEFDLSNVFSIKSDTPFSNRR